METGTTTDADVLDRPTGTPHLEPHQVHHPSPWLQEELSPSQGGAVVSMLMALHEEVGEMRTSLLRMEGKIENLTQQLRATQTHGERIVTLEAQVRSLEESQRQSRATTMTAITIAIASAISVFGMVFNSLVHSK